MKDSKFFNIENDDDEHRIDQDRVDMSDFLAPSSTPATSQDGFVAMWRQEIRRLVRERKVEGK